MNVAVSAVLGIFAVYWWSTGEQVKTSLREVRILVVA